MDTISRENNNSYLPIAGVIVGLLALVLSAVALVKVSSTAKTVAGYAEKIDKIDSIETSVQSAAADAEKAKNDIAGLQRQTQDAVNQIANDLGNIHASITKLEEAGKKAPAKVAKNAPGGGNEGAAPGTVTAEGTYVVKSGDSLAKIARANGVSLADLEAANPGIDPKKLKVGQKINLPAKK